MVAGLIAALPRLAHDVESDEPARHRKSYRRDVCADVVVRRKGLYGIDLVRCGSCRIEKMKRGALKFGGFNELVLEDLSVVIPPAGGGSVGDCRAERTSGTPRKVLQGLGIGDEFLSLRKLPMRFSSLRVERLSVSRLEGTNVVAVFSAERGVAKREGLALTDCRVVTPTGTNDVGKALLTVEPVLRLVWPFGDLDLYGDNGNS